MNDCIWNTLIVGLGQMGLGYDYNLNHNEYLISHSAAVNAHPNFKLWGGVDPAPLKQADFQRKYKGKVFSSLNEVPSRASIDIICLAPPTDFHYQEFEKVLAFKPKVILVEKPFGKDITQAKQLLAKAKQQDCLVIVNYIRRFEPSILSLKQLIRSNNIGHITQGIIRYNKSLYNIGSHFINLLLFLLGPVTHISALGTNRTKVSPLTPEFILYFKDTPIYFFASDFEEESLLHLVDMQLLTSQTRIDYVNGGTDMLIYQKQQHPFVNDYYVLDNPKRIPSDMNKVQYHVLSKIKSLLLKPTATQDYSGAIETHDVLKKVMELCVALTGKTVYE